MSEATATKFESVTMFDEDNREAWHGVMLPDRATVVTLARHIPTVVGWGSDGIDYQTNLSFVDSDGKSFMATPVSIDLVTDVAVLKVN